jgi:hypothetical protein
MSTIVVESHLITFNYIIQFSTNVIKECREPHHSKTVSIQMTDNITVNEEFLKSTIHIVIVKILIGGRS